MRTPTCQDCGLRAAVDGSLCSRCIDYADATPDRDARQREEGDMMNVKPVRLSARAAMEMMRKWDQDQISHLPTSADPCCEGWPLCDCPQTAKENRRDAAPDPEGLPVDDTDWDGAA